MNPLRKTSMRNTILSRRPRTSFLARGRGPLRMTGSLSPISEPVQRPGPHRLVLPRQGGPQLLEGRRRDRDVRRRDRVQRDAGRYSARATGILAVNSPAHGWRGSSPQALQFRGGVPQGLHAQARVSAPAPMPTAASSSANRKLSSAAFGLVAGPLQGSGEIQAPGLEPDRGRRQGRRGPLHLQRRESWNLGVEAARDRPASASRATCGRDGAPSRPDQIRCTRVVADCPRRRSSISASRASSRAGRSEPSLARERHPMIWSPPTHGRRPARPALEVRLLSLRPTPTIG